MPIDGELDPMAAGAVTEAADLLASLGHEVEEFEAPWAGNDLLPIFTVIFGTGIATAIYFGGLLTGREPSEDLVEPLSWETWKIIQERGGMDYLLARTQLQAVSRAWIALMDTVRRGAHPRPGRAPGRRSARSTPAATTRWTTSAAPGNFTPYTASYNVSGQPAISLPLFHGADGLPLADPAGRAPRRRGHPAVTGRAARGGPPVGGPPARAGRGLGRARSGTAGVRAHCDRVSPADLHQLAVALVAEQLERVLRRQPAHLVHLVVGREAQVLHRAPSASSAPASGVPWCS